MKQKTERFSSTGNAVHVPPDARAFCVFVAPAPASVMATAGRSHLVVTGYDNRDVQFGGLNHAVPSATPVLQLDGLESLDWYGQFVPLPEGCKSLVVSDGGAAGASPILHGSIVFQTGA